MPGLDIVVEDVLVGPSVEEPGVVVVGDTVDNPSAETLTQMYVSGCTLQFDPVPRVGFQEVKSSTWTEFF